MPVLPVTPPYEKFAQVAKTSIESRTDITNSASLISSKVEESLDIVSDTAAWPLAHDYRSAAASFSRP